MKILVVSEVFHPEHFLINDLVLEWKNLGIEVDILTQHPSYPLGRIFPGYSNRWYAAEMWNGSVIHRFKLIEGYRDSKLRKILNYGVFIWQGSRVARKIGKDYDHIFIAQTGPLTVACPALAIKNKFKSQVSIWTFDLWPDAIYAYGIPRYRAVEKIIERMIRKIYSRCDNIFVSSEGFIPHLRQIVPGKHIVYAPNWPLPENEGLKSPVRLENDKFNFTFTGNISKAQNLENVIRGFDKAGLEGSVLNIVGDGSYFETIRALVGELHNDNIRLWGSCPAGEIADILSRSDVLLLPLRADKGLEKTEPLKFQSYLKAGKAIMGVINGTVRQLIETHDLGICANPENIESISVVFEEMVSYAKSHNAAIARNSEILLNTRFDKYKTIASINSTMDL